MSAIISVDLPLCLVRGPPFWSSGATFPAPGKSCNLPGVPQHPYLSWQEQDLIQMYSSGPFPLPSTFQAIWGDIFIPCLFPTEICQEECVWQFPSRADDRNLTVWCGSCCCQILIKLVQWRIRQLDEDDISKCIRTKHITLGENLFGKSVGPSGKNTNVYLVGLWYLKKGSHLSLHIATPLKRQ